MRLHCHGLHERRKKEVHHRKLSDTRYVSNSTALRVHQIPKTRLAYRWTFLLLPLWRVRLSYIRVDKRHGNLVQLSASRPKCKDLVRRARLGVLSFKSLSSKHPLARQSFIICARLSIYEILLANI